MLPRASRKVISCEYVRVAYSCVRVPRVNPPDPDTRKAGKLDTLMLGLTGAAPARQQHQHGMGHPVTVQLMLVNVPPNVHAGEQMAVTTLTGHKYLIVVPQGAGPSSQFYIAVPPPPMACLLLLSSDELDTIARLVSPSAVGRLRSTCRMLADVATPHHPDWASMRAVVLRDGWDRVARDAVEGGRVEALRWARAQGVRNSPLHYWMCSCAAEVRHRSRKHPDLPFLP